MPPKKREEITSGGVVFRRFGGVPQYLLILDGHDNWGFPKGHLEQGESTSDAAHREILKKPDLPISPPMPRCVRSIGPSEPATSSCTSAVSISCLSPLQEKRVPREKKESRSVRGSRMRMQFQS